MRTVSVQASVNYDVLIGEGLVSQVGEHLAKLRKPCTAAIVTDTTVDALFGDTVEASLKAAGFRTIRHAFPAGEQNKTLETLSDILEDLAEQHLTRSDIVVALGGGVPGDVGGFASAVYARGIPFIQVPTTLLASVDSSVGGKTAVDLKAGKNLAGRFHQPSLVLTDTDIIRNLPEGLLSDGAAEIIKYGVLCDPELFDLMCSPDWKDHIDEIIERSVSIKRDVVNADEFDNGLRKQLNLGHTFGHAIEKCSDFTITHGQGVAIGMLIAAGAAGQEEVCRKIAVANKACGLPVKVPYTAEMLAEAAMSDKKRAGDSISLILPESIGKCYEKKIPVSELIDAFRKGIAMTEAIG